MLQHKIDVFFLFESLSDKRNGKINKLVALVSFVRPTGEHNFKGYPWDTYISRFGHFSDTINRVFPSTFQVSFQEQKKFPPTYSLLSDQTILYEMIGHKMSPVIKNHN